METSGSEQLYEPTAAREILGSGSTSACSIICEDNSNLRDSVATTYRDRSLAKTGKIDSNERGSCRLSSVEKNSPTAPRPCRSPVKGTFATSGNFQVTSYPSSAQSPGTSRLVIAFSSRASMSRA
jgi:hypothetical protein